MGILFDQYLCSILIVNHCQESRLTGSWSLVRLLPSLSLITSLPVLFSAFLVYPLMQLFSSLVLLFPGPLTQKLHTLEFVFKGFCCSESSEETRGSVPVWWLLYRTVFHVNCLVPGTECLYCGLHKGKRAPIKELSSLSSSPWVDWSWQWEWFR